MVKLIVRDKESIQEAVRRFRKLVERSGIKKEMRRREYYEKPSEIRRRARLRAERRARRTTIKPGLSSLATFVTEPAAAHRGRGARPFESCRRAPARCGEDWARSLTA